LFETEETTPAAGFTFNAGRFDSNRK
jgi:hypothetical protein